MPPRGLNLILCILLAHEPVLVQTVLAQPTVKALDHSVIGGLTWSAEVQLYPAFIGPFVHNFADWSWSYPVSTGRSEVLCFRVKCVGLRLQLVKAIRRQAGI